MTGPRRRRPARRPTPPPPAWSERLYLRLDPRCLAKLQFLLEGWDNLGVLTVLDTRSALAQLMYSPHQAEEVRRFLDVAGSIVPLTLVASPHGET